jgi:hypothetical protein
MTGCLPPALARLPPMSVHLWPVLPESRPAFVRNPKKERKEKAVEPPRPQPDYFACLVSKGASQLCSCAVSDFPVFDSSVRTPTLRKYLN